MCSTWGQVYLSIRQVAHIVHTVATEGSPMAFRHQSPSATYAVSLPFAGLLEDGHLHRAVRIGAQLSVLEDLALFPEPRPVESMKLYHVSCAFGENRVYGLFMIWSGRRSTFSLPLPFLQGWLLVGSQTEVTQVNTSNCGRLQSCSECVLAQDPVCAWSFRLEACVAHAGEHRG